MSKLKQKTVYHEKELYELIEKELAKVNRGYSNWINYIIKKELKV